MPTIKITRQTTTQVEICNGACEFVNCVINLNKALISIISVAFSAKTLLVM